MPDGLLNQERDLESFCELQDDKDAVIEQLFIAYRQVGKAYQKAQTMEMRNQMDALRHTLDMALWHLFPLSDYQEDVWREVRTFFRSRRN